jgi:hypothetical protein
MFLHFEIVDAVAYQACASYKSQYCVLPPLFLKQIIFRFSNKKYSSFVFAVAVLFRARASAVIGEKAALFRHCSRDLPSDLRRARSEPPKPMGSFARWMGRGNHRLSISNKSLSGDRKTEGGGLPLLPQGVPLTEPAGTRPLSVERQRAATPDRELKIEN